MAVINIRDVDEGLARELKARAAREGKSLREFCIQVLAQGLTGDMKPIIQKVGAPVMKPKERIAPPILAKEVENKATTASCPECGEPMADWNREWRCNNCKKLFKK